MSTLSNTSPVYNGPKSEWLEIDDEQPFIQPTDEEWQAELAAIRAHQERVCLELLQPNRNCKLCNEPIDEPRFVHSWCDHDPRDFAEY